MPDPSALSPTAALLLALLAALVLALAAVAGLLELTRRHQRRRLAALAARVVEAEAALRATQAELGRAERTAEAADQAKARFLAAASHDLRQPAHALGLYLATLRATLAPPGAATHDSPTSARGRDGAGDGPDAERAELLERMAASLAALEAQLTRLLDLSRLEAGALEPNWDLVPLEPLLRRLADEFGALAETRGLRLALHLGRAPDDVPRVSVTDPVLLERVLRNLLANAVKHTARGGVLLACRARRVTDGTGEADGDATAPGALQWRIEVWDSGPGIAEADRERVFEPFQQLANPARSRAGGQGLGLAIVRGLAQVLGLQVALHSRPGRGSVFFVEGLAPSGSVPQAAAAARAALQRLRGMRVALLEDDDEVRDATTRLLASWGVEVIAAADADGLADAVAAAPAGAGSPGAGPPQALVADVRLGGGRHGPDEAARLARRWGRAVPLLLVSGETAPEVLAALRAGGHTCLAKPVAPSRLRAWLEQVQRTAGA
jgi:signal transduction histidine kinase